MKPGVIIVSYLSVTQFETRRRILEEERELQRRRDLARQDAEPEPRRRGLLRVSRAMRAAAGA